jgi:hypothetical protein
MKYVGLRAIAHRMGWKSPTSPIRAMKSRGFLMVELPIHGAGCRWYTNDDLIYTWELQQARRAARNYRIGHRRDSNRKGQEDGISNGGIE